MRGHERAALTLNFTRSLIDGGFADLHHPEYWDLEFVKHSPLAAEYQSMVDQIGDGLRFMETLVGVNVAPRDSWRPAGRRGALCRRSAAATNGSAAAAPAR